MKNYKKMSIAKFATEVKTDERLKVDISNTMVAHGGSFVRALGVCLQHADPINTYLIAETFVHYLLRYLPSEWD